MGRTAEVRAVETMEHGSITFLHRPVEKDRLSQGPVQRLLMLLQPSGGQYERLVAVGRRRTARSLSRTRFWGFVDLVLTRRDMNAALGAQVYGTRTRGLRHLPAARPVAKGSYEIFLHDDHSHLRWSLDHTAPAEPAGTILETDADYILTVANPDPAAWGLTEVPDLQSELFDELELHVTLPTPFPPPLQRRFGGSKFAQLDSPEWLEHPGAEIVFLGEEG